MARSLLSDQTPTVIMDIKMNFKVPDLYNMETPLMTATTLPPLHPAPHLN